MEMALSAHGDITDYVLYSTNSPSLSFIFDRQLCVPVSDTAQQGCVLSSRCHGPELREKRQKKQKTQKRRRKGKKSSIMPSILNRVQLPHSVSAPQTSIHHGLRKYKPWLDVLSRHHESGHQHLSSIGCHSHDFLATGLQAFLHWRACSQL